MPLLEFDYGVLRAYRKRHRLKQSDVAKLMNCTGATISRWELGIVPITAEDLCRLAEIYNIENMSTFFVRTSKETVK